MHTVKVLVAAFALLGLCIAAARASGAAKDSFIATGAKWFIPLWFIGAAVNMYIGITQAGYTFMEELPMFFIVFGIPALVAALLIWKPGGAKK